ncbi:hypothetical protein BGZ58_002198 [Dissophora ornata]|nr:hypothetical protein BGZ58_002198 [Dissophora ornata]
MHIPRSSTTINTTTNTGSALIDDQGCLTTEDEDELPEEDEEEIADLLEREEKVRSTKRLKTATVSLKDIIRKEPVASEVDDDPDKLPGLKVSAADKLPSIGQGGVCEARLGGADSVMEARMMLEVMEDTLDEMDKEAEAEENQAQENQDQKDVSYVPRPKELSKSHLKAIQAIAKTLLESANLNVSQLNASWVRRTAHKPESLTDEQCDKVVRIVKVLHLYTPK